eukprot:1767759-Prymnesium_polylepis.2
MDRPKHTVLLRRALQRKWGALCPEDFVQLVAAKGTGPGPRRILRALHVFVRAAPVVTDQTTSPAHVHSDHPCPRCLVVNRAVESDRRQNVALVDFEAGNLWDPRKL